MYQKLSSYVVLAVFVLGLGGCGTRLFSARETNPVIEDYLGTWPARELGSLATKAGHRVNVTRMSDGTVVDKDRWQRGEFCLEPLPDAMESVASQFSSKIAGEGKATDQRTNNSAEGKGEVDLLRSMATAMTPLLRRSQGLQWARDNMTFVCNSYLNRRITPDQYKSLVDTIIKESAELIKAEIPSLPKFEINLSGTLGQAPAVPPPPKNVGVQGDGANKLAKSEDVIKPTDKNALLVSDGVDGNVGTKKADRPRSLLARWLPGLFD